MMFDIDIWIRFIMLHISSVLGFGGSIWTATVAHDLENVVSFVFINDRFWILILCRNSHCGCGFLYGSGWIQNVIQIPALHQSCFYFHDVSSNCVVSSIRQRTSFLSKFIDSHSGFIPNDHSGCNQVLKLDNMAQAHLCLRFSRLV